MDEKVLKEAGTREVILNGIMMTIFSLFFIALITNGLYSNYRTYGTPLENATGYSKVGKSTMVNYFGLIRLGDDSYQTALKNGSITKIHHVDTESKGWLGKKVMTTYVYGE